MKTWYGIPSFWCITSVVHLLSGCSQACPVFVEFCHMSETSFHSKPPVALLPSLYEETGIEIVLIRIVHMGPWTHNVDDGLETLCMRPCIPWYVSPSLQMLVGPHNSARSQLDIRLAKLNLCQFFGHVVPGVSNDSNEIKVISHMTFRCTCRCGSTTGRATPQLKKTMKGATVTKDRLNKTLNELQRTVLPGRHHLKRCSPRRNSTWRWSDMIFVFEALGSKRHKPVERWRGQRPAAIEETLGGGSPLRMR